MGQQGERREDNYIHNQSAATTAAAAGYYNTIGANRQREGIISRTCINGLSVKDCNDGKVVH